MDRRQLLFTCGAAFTAITAGCGSTQDEQTASTQPPNDSNAPTTAAGEPSVSWTESWIGGEQYQVRIDVDLNGNERIEIQKGTENTLTEITEGGSHTIAGENLEQGPLRLGTLLQVVVPDETVPQIIGSHTVGSQEQPSFPLFLNGLSASTAPPDPEGETFPREYQQEVHEPYSEFALEIPEYLYDYYESRIRSTKYGVYVSDNYDEPYVDQLATSFEDFRSQNDLSSREMVNQTIGFVQSLEYTRDAPATGYDEYPKYPIETLVDKEGDCEDTVILLAQLLDSLGYGTVLLIYYEAEHMALGVAGEEAIDGTYYDHNGQRYYYLETTTEGWSVGEKPPDVTGDPEIQEVQEQPSLVHRWGLSVSSQGGVTIESEVRNEGGPGSFDGKIRFEFQNESGGVIESTEKALPDISPESSRTIELSATPPDDQALRVQSGIFLDGELHDTVKTEYREPTNS